MNHLNTRSLLPVLAVVAALAFAAPAEAATLGDVANKIKGQYGAFADAVTGALMLIGIVIGGIAALKFKAHNENPQQVKIGTPLTLMLVAALLIGLPAYLNMTKNTVLDGTGNQLNGSVYGSIGNG